MPGVAAPPSNHSWGIDWTIAGILGLLIITVLAGIPLTLTVQASRESDALVIDMAGRQRMLLERYMKELLLASQGIAAKHDHTRAVLEERLHALIHGGSTAAHVDRSDRIVLPPAPTGEIKLTLLEQQRGLEAFARHAEAFLRTPARAVDYERQRDALLRENTALLEKANEAVTLFARHSSAQIRSIIQWEIAVVLLVVAVASIRTWRFLRAEKELKRTQAVAMEALRQSDQVKSSLLSSVSHELRTPLTAIKSMVFGLREDGHLPLKHSRKELLATIDEQVDYLNRLVGNLLDMSRLEAGTLQPRREWHVFDELAEGAIRRVEPLLGKRPLRVDVAPDLPPLYVDGVQIQQVLVNLLDNACKFSPAGSPIDVVAGLAGEVLDVRVTSAGADIPSDELARIFDRFYRVQTGRVVAAPGTGLGLAICKGIVEAHGGRILAQSSEGRTTILFRVPLAAPRNGDVPLVPGPDAMPRSA